MPMAIKLAPMNEEQYIRFLDAAIKNYADDKVKARTWAKNEALEKSQLEFSTLLPNGIATDDHVLFSVENDGQQIGILWLHIRNKNNEKQAFIYDIELFEEERGKGFGKATMAALDDYANQVGIKKIGLHVFAHNPRAIALYEKCGYETTDISMSKRYS
jgi:RimJ/RimL family protein N-acetyltransferase